MFHPILITGLLLAGLPVVLHLIMRQEPKRIIFPAFRFLQERQRTNQRKIRLRHWLLLALRMLLIVLIALALFQPSLVSSAFSFRSDQPVVAVIILDTSPSMGYILADRGSLNDTQQQGLRRLDEQPQGAWTALDEARARALEILDELPPNSVVAIVDPSDTNADWSNTLVEARRKIQALRKTRANALPITRSLATGYRLFAQVGDRFGPEAAQYGRFLAILSDRTESSWDASQLDDLIQARNAVGTPAINSFYLDVGVAKPIDAAITELVADPILGYAGQPIRLRATLSAIGPKPAEQVLVCKVDGKEVDKKSLTLTPGEIATVEFVLPTANEGWHQAELAFANTDALPQNNTRYITFRIETARRTLAIVDVPSPGFTLIGGAIAERGLADRLAWPWAVALKISRRYSCDIVTTNEFDAIKEISQYEMITLAGLSEPSDDLWAKLETYVRSGGKLVVLPGGYGMKAERYQAAKKLLPAQYSGSPITLQKQPGRVADEVGIPWAWESVRYDNGLMKPFKAWLADPKHDFVQAPPKAWVYWVAEDANRAEVIATYADAPEAEKRHPALLERTFGSGKIIQFTTSMTAHTLPNNEQWNDYLTSSFYLTLVNEVARYLTGTALEPNYNHANTDPFSLTLPRDAATRPPTYYLGGPDISGQDAIVTRDETSPLVRFRPERFPTPGNFRLESSEKEAAKRYTEAFSLNQLASESQLTRMAIEPIEELLGQGAVSTPERNLNLRSGLGAFQPPLQLFPFLMMLLVLFLAFENWMSNRFYRKN